MRIGSKAVAETVVQNIALDAPPRSVEEVVINAISLHPEWGLDPIEKASIWTPQVYRFCNALEKIRSCQLNLLLSSIFVKLHDPRRMFC
jgi:hypothetical protein